MIKAGLERHGQKGNKQNSSRPLKMHYISSLEVILKTIERCNINCSYCYFFNGIDNSYIKHPKYISLDTIKHIAHFLNQGCLEYQCENLVIDFHGGEPLMQRKNDFDKTCVLFREIIHPKINIAYNIQTNAMLIDDDWIALFNKHNVSVGVSLDGPKEINDSARIDHAGKGTYNRTIKGLHLLQKATNESRLTKNDVALLCVINPQYSAKTIYRHFVDDLKITNMDFLLPDFTHNTWETHQRKTGLTIEDYGIYLCDLFDEWAKDDNPSIYIRILKSTLSMLMGGSSSMLNFGPAEATTRAFTIASNGDLSPDDTLRNTNPQLMNTDMNVKSATLKEFLNAPVFHTLDFHQQNRPEVCQACCWENICGGGFLINRYKIDNTFNNPSIMCASLKKLYQKVTSYLLNTGYDKNKIEKVLLN